MSSRRFGSDMATKILFLIASTALVGATTPPPFDSSCRILDQVFEHLIDRSDSTGSTAAFDILTRVAAGKAPVPPETEALVDVAAGTFSHADFKNPVVRAYAFYRIGESGLPVAIDFLQNLKFGDLGEDQGQQMWTAARVGLRTALLNRIAEPRPQIEFLISVLSELRAPKRDSAIESWAINQLCDRGVTSVLPLIRESIEKRLSGRSAEDEINFCVSRMQVVLRDSDRVKALGSVLNRNTDDVRILRWALTQLATTPSESAAQEVNRFANEIEALPTTAPMNDRIHLIREEIQYLRFRYPWTAGRRQTSK